MMIMVVLYDCRERHEVEFIVNLNLEEFMIAVIGKHPAWGLFLKKSNPLEEVVRNKLIGMAGPKCEDQRMCD